MVLSPTNQIYMLKSVHVKGGVCMCLCLCVYPQEGSTALSSYSRWNHWFMLFFRKSITPLKSQYLNRITCDVEKTIIIIVIILNIIIKKLREYTKIYKIYQIYIEYVAYIKYGYSSYILLKEDPLHSISQMSELR